MRPLLNNYTSGRILSPFTEVEFTSPLSGWFVLVNQLNRNQPDIKLLNRISVQWTFYSATSFLQKCRKVVLEKWFFKLVFFFWSNTFLQPEKIWIYSINPPFFLVNQFYRTRKKNPCLKNHCRLNGQLCIVPFCVVT